jgi:hypothetical protein
MPVARANGLNRQGAARVNMKQQHYCRVPVSLRKTFHASRRLSKH